MMQSQTGGPPADESQFKNFIAQNAAILERMGAANADEIFISERDGQPFVVIYGKQPPGMAATVVAYEREGVDGKRLVGHSTRMIDEVDEARFRELVPASAQAK